jgi:hypothetical protein
LGLLPTPENRCYAVGQFSNDPGFW